MKPRLVDSHTHAQFSAFDNDRDEVVRRALAAGIWMVNVGTDREMSKKAIDFANRYESGVFAAVGLHPADADEEFDHSYYKKLAQDPKTVAIGECGLDYFRLAEETGEKQKQVFELQIQLAGEVKKPLMIHCRNAFADLISVLASHRQLLTSPPGICHFFSGTTEDAKKLMDLGFSFSFGGVITFAREYEKLIRFIPLSRILLETDAPYVAPVPYRGQRNEPAYVEEVARKIAKILGKDFDEIVRTTTENAKRIFGFK